MDEPRLPNNISKSLLDIGPTAEGEIIAPMMNNLLDAGSWLDFGGDCVYDTVCVTHKL